MTDATPEYFDAQIEIASIIVLPNRQRREVKTTEDLEASISRIGLMHPLILNDQNQLIAGERRLISLKNLGWTTAPVRYRKNLSKDELQLIELEENTRRADLTWQDEVLAIGRYHEICLNLSENPAEWTIKQTAERMGINPSIIRKKLSVLEYFEDESVTGFDKFVTAYNFVQRKNERAHGKEIRLVDSAIDDIIADKKPRTTTGDDKTPRGIPGQITSSSPDLDEQIRSDIAEVKPILAEIKNLNFHEFALTERKDKFNFIHCDFPYGKNIGDKDGQSAANTHGTYEDTEEVYFNLMDSLAAGMDNIVADSAHLIFWFSMDYYVQTVTRLKLMGWRIWPNLLIWHKSDNKGILAAKDYGPRHTHEVAIFASRNKRKIVRAVADSFSGPVSRSTHTSEKAYPMLEHFSRMVVDESTFMLDPTCGSGNSVKASLAQGAKYSLGLELNPMFALTAQESLAKALRS